MLADFRDEVREERVPIMQTALAARGVERLGV
jgi:hypothetical protein